MLAALIPFITGLAGTLVAQFAKWFAVEGAKAIAMRALLLFIVWTVLPIVLYNVASDLIINLITYAVSRVSSSGNFSAITIQLTGLAGWIGIQIGLSNSISIIMSAVATRFILSFIPFWGK